MCNNDRIWILMTRKLSGEATSTELKELDALLSPLPEGKSIVLNKVEGIWNESLTHDKDFMEATYLAHLERMKDRGLEMNSDEPALSEADIETVNRPKKWLTFSNMAFAVIIVICVLGGWAMMDSRNLSDQSLASHKAGKEVQTPKGARTKIKLPDGSDIWLNAGSKLNYDEKFDGDTREVYLTGEAYFDVVHDASRPFIIHTSNINVKVLGTQFNVKAYSNDKTTETSLIKGSVEVFLKNDPSKKYLLKPNQKLVLQNESLLAAQNASAQEPANPVQFNPKAEITELTYMHDEKKDVESSWTRNILSFEDELFSEVAKKLERWYDVTIVFKNKRWEREYISGSFEQESPEQAMNALKYSTGFNFKISGKTITIY